MSKVQYKHIDLAGASLVQRRHKRQVIPPGMWAVKNFLASRSDSSLTMRPDFLQENVNVFGISSGLQIQNFDATKDILNSVHGVFGTENIIWFTTYIPWGIYNTTGFEQILSSSYSTGRAMATDDDYTVEFKDIGAYDIRKKWWRGCVLEFNGDGDYYLIDNIYTGHASNGTGTVSLTLPTQSDYSNDVDYLGGTYKFTSSGGGSNEYYCELLAGGDPSLTDPFYVYLDDSLATEGAVGSLGDHEWGWGDGDTLGYNTLYFADATGDPDVSGITLVGRTGHTYEVYRTHNSFRADSNKLEIDEFGGAILYCSPTIENNFSARDICGPFYSNVTESDWEYQGVGYINTEDDYYSSIDYLDSAYQWTKSDRYAYAYYLELDGGGDPSISAAFLSDGIIKVDGSIIPKSWEGTAQFSGWEYGDRDELGFSTIYISAYNQGNPGDPSDVFSTVVGYYNDVEVAYRIDNYSLATTGTSWILLNSSTDDDGGFWRSLDISKDEAWDWIPLRDYCTINVPQPNGDDVLNSVSDNPLVFTSIRRNTNLGFLASGYVLLTSATGGGTTRYPCLAYSTDQGFEWTVKIDPDNDGTNSTSLGCEFDGTTLFMLSKPSGTDHYFRYSTDSGATWTTCAGVTDIDGTAPKVKYINSTFIVVGNDESIYYSSDGQTFTEKDMDADLSDFVGSDIAYNESASGSAYWVAVDDTEQIIGRATTVGGTYSDVTPAGLATMTWHDPALTYVFYDILGQRFIINCGTFLLISTDDGATWKQTAHGIEDVNLLTGFVYPSNFDWSGQLLVTMYDRGSNNDFQHLVLSRDYVISWEVDLFVPVSDLYRATTFAVIDGYTVLIGTSEWDSDNEEWDYHPKRIRWTSPGTYNDFTTSGTGTADAAGPGAFLASKVANGRIIVFESNRISSIVPRGDTDDPWDFDVIKENFKILSNPVAVDDIVYFVGSDGLLWSSDGINVEEVGASFDATQFDDFDEKKPIWLVYSRAENSLYSFYRDENASTHSAYVVSLATGSVSEVVLIEVSDDSAPKAEKPGSVVAVGGSTIQKLYVSHHPFSDDPDLVSVARLSIGSPITGVDDLGSSKTGYFASEVESGELYITREGEKSSIKHLIIETYTKSSGETNFDTPYLVAEVKSIEDGAFSSPGDAVGTATMTDSALTGSGTAWSTKIAGPTGDGDTTQACDGAETDFTLPCLGSQARVYLDSTLQVAGTDYTVSGKTISFDSAPAATKTLYAYWENYPEVKVKAGDFFKSSEGWHRVTEISSAQDITLDHYLSSGSEVVTHYPAWQLDDGHGKIEVGINRLVEGVQIRLYLIPKYDGTKQSTIAKITGLSIGYVPQGRKIVKATGS